MQFERLKACCVHCSATRSILFSNRSNKIFFIIYIIFSVGLKNFMILEINLKFGEKND